MNQFRSRLSKFTISPALAPLLLLGVAGLSYALLIPWLGFYWDEWPITWIAHKLGPDGLARYFSTNRPYWGMLYRLTTPLIGYEPWRWQLFGLFWRWIAAAALWACVRRVWPRQGDAPLWASLLFLVYPGFTQQSIGMMYGHFFVVLSAFLLSLLCSLLALERPGEKLRFWGLTALALLLGLINLLAMEYFFLLEVLRPGFIYLALRSHSGEKPQPEGWLRRSILYELPYLALFAGVTVWRAFFFPYQTQNYNLGLLERLKADPLGALSQLAATAGHDIFMTALEAWKKAFIIPASLGARTTLAYAGLIAATFLLLLVFLLKIRSSQPDQPEQPAKTNWALSAVLLGLAGLALAGVPFWLTGLEINLAYPNNRFTLPFMLGASLLVTGLLGLLPIRRLYKTLLLCGLVALSVGSQFQNAVSFQRDWNAQKDLFWQMSWRIPGIQPGTTFISSNLPLRYFSDNSLTGPLNWIYAPENRSQEMSYMFYFASIRSEMRPLFEKDRPIRQDYLAAVFNGSTGQMVAVNYQAPGCFRVLDPLLDAGNGMLPELMRVSAQVSDDRWILPEGSRPKADLTPAIFGQEPARNWCYYFEKADLARQQGDWQKVAALGDEAFSQKDYPNDPMERLPFVEGYAHTGDWQRAQELSADAADITPMMKPILCRLWQRIDSATPKSGEKTAVLQTIHADLECQP